MTATSNLMIMMMSTSVTVFNNNERDNAAVNFKRTRLSRLDGLYFNKSKGR